MDVNYSIISSLNSFSSLQTLLGSMYQVGFGAQTGVTTGIDMLSNLLSIGQSNLFQTESLSDQQAQNMAALNLSNATAPLNAVNTNSIFNQTSAVSTNANAVTATTLANAAPGVFEVGVSQLAQGQTVTGAQTTAIAPTGVATTNGYGQIEFSMNGNVQDVTFQLNGSETNQEALGTIAAEINGRGFGITAGVAVNQGGNASLNLTGPTGVANVFTVTDILGNAAAFTGIGSPANVTQNAQNSVYTVNGAGFSDTTNQPTLVNTGLQLNLLQPTGILPVNITVGSDSTKTTTAVNSFVSAFNSTLNSLSAGTSLSSRTNATNLATLAQANASNLQNIGISVGTSGSLTVNATELQNALTTQPGAVNAAFNGTNSFASGVQTMANSVINQSFSSTGNIDFSNYFNSGFQSAFNVNSLIASNLGLFFNNYL